jgi:hypothetical protein
MRDIETIDSELRLVAALRYAARDRGGPLPSPAPMDELLDERFARRGRPSSRGCECEAPNTTATPATRQNPCVVLAGLTCLAALTDEPELASRACPFLGAARRENRRPTNYPG